MKKVIIFIDKLTAPLNPLIFPGVEEEKKETLIYHYSFKHAWVLSSLLLAISFIIHWVKRDSGFVNTAEFVSLISSFLAVTYTFYWVHLTYRPFGNSEMISLVKRGEIFKEIFLCVVISSLLFVVFFKLLPREIEGTAGLILAYLILCPYFFCGVLAASFSGVIINFIRLVTVLKKEGDE